MKITKTLIGKSKTTTGNAYRITLSNRRGKAVFTYNDNYLNKSTDDEIIYSYKLDAESYANSRDLIDFCHEFGYTDQKEGKKIYDACKLHFEGCKRLGLL